MKTIRPLLFLSLWFVFFACQDDEPAPEPEPEPPACYTLEKTNGDTQIGLSGETLPQTLNVRVVDKQGKSIQGEKIHWAVISGDGIISADTTQTDAQGNTQVSLTLGDSEIQTVTATLVRENDNICAETTSVSFSARVGTFELLDISYTSSGEIDCKVHTGNDGYNHIFQLGYSSDLDLSRYFLFLRTSFKDNTNANIPTDRRPSGPRTSTAIENEMCIFWGDSEWLEVTYRIEVVSPATDSILFTSNEKTIRIENPVESPTEIPTITLLSVKDEITEINSEFCKDINGSTVSTEIAYESSVPLDGYYVENVVYYQFDYQNQENSFADKAESHTANTINDRSCIRFSIGKYVDLSYEIWLYAMDANGQKVGEVLSKSNKIKSGRIFKPASANRTAYDRKEPDLAPIILP